MTKLECLLEYVSQNNSYYKDIIKTYNITNPLDITQYPLLTREMVQKNRYSMFSNGFKNSFFYSHLKRQSSSGSSGIPVNVYWDYGDYYASNIMIWHKRKEHFGVNLYDRQVVFGLTNSDLVGSADDLYYTNEPNNVLNISINTLYTEQGLGKLVNLINEFQPTWIYLRPFVLQRLIYAYKHFKSLPPSSLVYIESYGEILSLELKRVAVEQFGVPVVNMYGSEEMNGIAYECINNKMHIFSDNVFVECMDENGNIKCSGEGEAVITSLTNKAMPLIRYKQGDIIVLEKNENCACGSISPTIAMIKGRTHDFIKIDDNTVISSVMLMDIIGEVNNIYNSIITYYKFLYSRSKHIIYLYIEIENERQKWFDSVKNTIEKVFHRRGISNIKITFVEATTYSEPSLKHTYFEIIE